MRRRSSGGFGRRRRDCNRLLGSPIPAERGVSAAFRPSVCININHKSGNAEGLYWFLFIFL